MPLDIKRHIARIRALPGGNWLALALTDTENYINSLKTGISTVTQNVTNVEAAGGTSESTSPSFSLYVNSFPVPNSAANLNDALPSPSAPYATAKVRIDPTIPIPNISFAYNNLANGLTAVNAVPFSATPVFDASLGNVQKITLTGNVTSFTITNPTAGQQITLLWLQDAAGAHTVAGAPVTLRGFTTPGILLSTYSAQSFVWDSANWVATSSGVQNV